MKKAVIYVSLVQESAEATNKDIERDILNELSKDWTAIPWLREVEKVKVVEE